MMFTEAMKKELNENTLQCTENGALGYATSGKALLDLNFEVASLRNADDIKIINDFTKAFAETPELAVKWLFFARDIRGGLGERRLFKVILKHLANTYPGLVTMNMSLIPQYGRWDDLFVLFNTAVEREMMLFIKEAFIEDLNNFENNNPISLLAKWMPSANSKKIETKDQAKKFAKYLGFSIKEYRQTVAKLRTYLDIVEKKMSANAWDKINYETVPSKANLIYSNAFYNHDAIRREQYLYSLRNGESKINASTLFPYEIMHKYISDNPNFCFSGLSVNETYEQLWKNLPDYVNGEGSTIVVADGSGSMCTTLSRNSRVQALDIAKSLALYFAERCSGEFKDKFITFSMRPQFVDLSNLSTLSEKIVYAYNFDECANTNIEAVFDLILNTAVKNNMKQEDIPKNILIISDMEFDRCACSNQVERRGSYFCEYAAADETLFTAIRKKYEAAGYKLPRLVFWNVCSRTNTIPVQENELGVALVSGFSPAVAQMVLSGELDPFKCLVEQLMSDRYKFVKYCDAKVSK